MAPAQASAFQHFAAIRSGHALPKTMNAQTAMDARLIGSFGHNFPFSRKNHIAKFASANYTLTNT
jgi:hypothetical protein